MSLARLVVSYNFEEVEVRGWSAIEVGGGDWGVAESWLAVRWGERAEYVSDGIVDVGGMWKKCTDDWVLCCEWGRRGNDVWVVCGGGRRVECGGMLMCRLGGGGANVRDAQMEGGGGCADV